MNLDKLLTYVPSVASVSPVHRALKEWGRPAAACRHGGGRGAIMRLWAMTWCEDCWSRMIWLSRTTNPGVCDACLEPAEVRPVLLPWPAVIVWAELCRPCLGAWDAITRLS